MIWIRADIQSIYGVSAALLVWQANVMGRCVLQIQQKALPIPKTFSINDSKSKIFPHSTAQIVFR